MNTIPLIRANAPKRFALFLEHIGAPVESLWTRACLPMRALEQGESLVPLNHALQFVEHAARVEDLPHLGILAARHLEFSAGSEFARRISRARTLLDAVATAQTLVRAHNSGERYWLAQQGDRVRICRRMSPDAIPSRQADLLTLTEMMDVVRRFAGPDWRPEEVSIQSAGHEGLERVEAFSEARIACGRPATSITLPRSLLPRSLIISGTPAPHPSAGASESDPWLASAPPPGFTDSVRALVRSLLPLGSLEVEIAAEGARMSVRSLQRRLTEEGTSFSRILDDVRFAAARGMLEGSDLKLIEIALELGYSDPAHFTRAFRRWTSVTPGMYRRMVPDAVRERRSA